MLLVRFVGSAWPVPHGEGDNNFNLFTKLVLSCSCCAVDAMTTVPSYCIVKTGADGEEDLDLLAQVGG